MAREAAANLYSDLHADRPFHNGTFTSWSKERTATHPCHFLEGVKFGTSKTDLIPNDKFTTDRNASPSGRVELESEDPGDGGVDAPLSAPGHDQPQDE